LGGGGAGDGAATLSAARVAGVAVAGVVGALRGFVSRHAPARVAPAHLGALGNAGGGALGALTAALAESEGAGALAVAVAGALVAGAIFGSAPALAQPPSALVAQIASHAVRPRLAQKRTEERGMRRSGRVVPDAVLFAVEAQ